MPNFKEGKEKAIVFKSGSKKDKKEPGGKSIRQKSGKSTKSASRLKPTKSNSKKKTINAEDRDDVFGGGGGGGQLKAKSALKTNKSNFSNSLTRWNSSSQTSAVDAPKQSSTALDSQSAVLNKRKSTADQHHVIKPKSSGIIRHRIKSFKKDTRRKSAPKGLQSAPGLLHIKAHVGTKAKIAKSHQELKPTPVDQHKQMTNPSTFHQNSHVNDGGYVFHTKSPVHEVMIPAGRVYKVVKVHKVDKDGKAASDSPWEYVWKYNDNSKEEPDHPMAQTSTEVIRQPPPAVNFVQVVKGPNLVLLNQPNRKEQDQTPLDDHQQKPPKGEKEEGK